MNVRFKALVVDDDAAICSCVVNRLSAMNHDCDCANCIDDARRLISEKKYDYVVLDMELPIQYGTPPDISVGEFFLKLLRINFSRDDLPVIVITAKMDNGQNPGLPSRIFYQEANDLLLKPLVKEGEHTLETSVRKFVEKKRGVDLMSNLPKEWLFREPDMNDKTIMVWRAIAKNGTERRYSIAINSIRGRLLDCINKMRFRGTVINHYDLIKASGTWNEKTYYAAKGGAPRGPIKGHMSWFKQKLGMKVTYVANGIIVEQPEE